MADFNGVGVALITPFKEDLSIDYAGLEKVLKHLYLGKVDYLVVMGTTGESSTLSPIEKLDILKFVKNNNLNNLPIVFGLGGNNTEAIAKEMKAFEVEVDAFLSVSPAYNKPSQLGIIKHFERLADVSKVPIILYNVPGRTSSNMEAATTLTLAKHPNIIGIKEASGSIIQCTEIAEKMPDNFLLISGDDMKTFDLINLGSSGVISVIANALPRKFSAMVKDALAGNRLENSELSIMNEFNDLIMVECNPSGIKSALNHLGICNDTVRLPLTTVSEGLDAEIKSLLEKL